jgi:nucleoside 2-deoxyribosyltransferase
MSVMAIYLAGPLFGIAELRFNRDMMRALESARTGIAVVLPQDRAGELLAQPNGVQLVFEDCLAMIDRCDVVLALLDGADADSGTCVELGYAYAKGKPVVGIRTDFRASEDRGLNLMVSHVCAELLLGVEESVEALARRALEAIDRVCLRPR